MKNRATDLMGEDLDAIGEPLRLDESVELQFLNEDFYAQDDAFASTSSLEESSTRKKVAVEASKKGTKLRRKRRSKNEDDKPKRPLSAYNLFFQLERARLLSGEPERKLFSPEEVAKVAEDHQTRPPRPHRKSHGKISFIELARAIAASWKKVDAKGKIVFENQANVEKARYREAVAAWRERRGMITNMIKVTRAPSTAPSFPQTSTFGSPLAAARMPASATAGAAVMNAPHGGPPLVNLKSLLDEGNLLRQRCAAQIQRLQNLDMQMESYLRGMATEGQESLYHHQESRDMASRGGPLMPPTQSIYNGINGMNPMQLSSLPCQHHSPGFSNNLPVQMGDIPSRHHFGSTLMPVSMTRDQRTESNLQPSHTATFSHHHHHHHRHRHHQGQCDNPTVQFSTLGRPYSNAMEHARLPQVHPMMNRSLSMREPPNTTPLQGQFREVVLKHQDSQQLPAIIPDQDDSSIVLRRDLDVKLKQGQHSAHSSPPNKPCGRANRNYDASSGMQNFR